ncbi:MAG: cation transporter [Rhodospirillaceae bacterium]|nr:cation transporter [Rhodospirillaceae bacterium]
MRKLIILVSALTISSGASAETILTSVNGMVCAFCATGIEKSFKKQAAVDTVTVDLDKKLVTLNTKPDKTLDDAVIKKVIGDAGYAVVSIERK